MTVVVFVFTEVTSSLLCCVRASLPQRDTVIKMCLVDYKMLFLRRVIRNKINLWPSFSLALSLFPFHPLLPSPHFLLKPSSFTMLGFISMSPLNTDLRDYCMSPF